MHVHALQGIPTADPVSSVSDQREVLTVAVAADLPTHDGAAVRVETHLKAGAAIRLPQLGERGLLGHIRLVKQKSRRCVNEERVLFWL